MKEDMAEYKGCIESLEFVPALAPLIFWKKSSEVNKNPSSVGKQLVALYEH